VYCREGVIVLHTAKRYQSCRVDTQVIAPKGMVPTLMKIPLLENQLILNSDNARQHDVSSHLYNTARLEAEAFMLSLFFGAPIYQLCD
jgi:hypothetical protein